MKRKHIEVRLVLHFSVPAGESVTKDDAEQLVRDYFRSNPPLPHPHFTGLDCAHCHDKAKPTKEAVDAGERSFAAAQTRMMRDGRGTARDALEEAFASMMEAMP